MDANIRAKKLIEERDELIDRILNNFSSWDGSRETGIEVLSTNEELIEEIKIINDKLSIFNVDNNDEYIDRLNLVISKQAEIIEVLKKEKNLLLESLNQLGKRNKIVDSYISNKKQPIFIDKDVL